MSHNMSAADRAVRALVVAPALIVAAALIGFGSVAAIVLAAVAAVMLATAAAGFCPLYTLLGVSTCRRPTQGA